MQSSDYLNNKALLVQNKTLISPKNQLGLSLISYLCDQKKQQYQSNESSSIDPNKYHKPYDRHLSCSVNSPVVSDNNKDSSLSEISSEIADEINYASQNESLGKIQPHLSSDKKIKKNTEVLQKISGYLSIPAEINLDESLNE